MKLTETQRNRCSTIILLLLVIDLIIAAWFAMIIHNLPAVMICTLVALTLFITEGALSIIRGFSVHNEIVSRHQSNITEIKRLIQDNAVDDLSPMQAEKILNILQSTRKS